MSKHRDKSVIRLVQQIGFRSSLNNPVSIQQFIITVTGTNHFIKQKKLFVEKFLLMANIMKLSNIKTALILVRDFFKQFS